MKIAIDVDEVLGNFTDPMIVFLNAKFDGTLKKENLKRYRFWKDFGLSMEDGLKLMNEFYVTDLFKNIMPIAGSIDGIKELKKKNELFVITSRQKKIVGKETEKWLDKYFRNSFNGLYFSSNSSFGESANPKHKFCKKLGADVIIEDSLYTARECASAGIKVLLLDYPWNQGALHKNITRVKDWDEILESLEDI